MVEQLKHVSWSDSQIQFGTHLISRYAGSGSHVAGYPLYVCVCQWWLYPNCWYSLSALLLPLLLRHKPPPTLDFIYLHWGSKCSLFNEPLRGRRQRVALHLALFNDGHYCTALPCWLAGWMYCTGCTHCGTEGERGFRLVSCLQGLRKQRMWEERIFICWLKAMSDGGF